MKMFMIVTKRKSKHCVYISCNLIGLLPKVSISDWLLQQETATTRILNQDKQPQSGTFIHKDTTSTVQLLQ